MDGIILTAGGEEYLDLLDDAQCGIVLRNLYLYSAGKDLLAMDALTKMAFTAFRQELDKEAEKRRATSEAHRIAGTKGGRPKKQKVITENQKNQMVSDEKPKKPKKAFGFLVSEDGEATTQKPSKQAEENQKNHLVFTETTDLIDSIYINNNNIKDNKKEKEKKEKRLTGDHDLDHALMDFIDHRKRMKAPMTERAIELLISRLTALFGENTADKVEALNRAIMNGWKSVYEDDKKKPERKEVRTKFSNIIQNGYDFGSLESQLLKGG